MKKLIVITSFILSGCSTVVPVTAKFPEVPEILTNKCAPLKQLKDDAKLSEISKTVVDNYASYYECAVIVEHWNEWYQIQKNIYEKAGK